MDLVKAKKAVEDACGGQYKKRGLSPCEQLAMTVLEPFLDVMGARIMQILDVAAQRTLEIEREKVKK